MNLDALMQLLYALASKQHPACTMATPAAKPIQPLKGIRILSLCLNLPGPVALARLKSMGAHCVKLEPPPAANGTGSDPMRSFSPSVYQALHVGIEVDTADLKQAQGQQNMHKTLSNADVLLTSFRPSALKKLGLSWRTLHQQYPQLSMVSIVSARGKRAEEPGHDLTYLAQHQLVNTLDLPLTLYADMAGALMACEAVLQAMLLRQLTGQVSHQEVALSDAAAHLAQPRSWGLTSPGTALGGAHAGYRLYPCANGRVAMAALEPHFSKALCEAAGLTWHGPTMMFEAAVHAHIAGFLALKSCADLAHLASARDIPLHTLPD